MRYPLKLNRPEPVEVKTEEQIEHVRKLMSTHELISLDTETTGLDIAKDVVVYWSFAVNLEERFFLTREQLQYFTEIWEDKSKNWIGSQIKYDAHMMANCGHPLAGQFFCTLTMDRLIDPGQLHGLKEAYEREFDERMKSFKETFFPKDAKGQRRKPSNKEMYEILVERYEVEPEQVIDYASMDAWATLRLFYRLRDRLRRIVTWAGYTLWEIMTYCESHMTRVLYEMEREGMPLDIEYVKECSPGIEDRMGEIETEINKRAGRMINLKSPKQLGAYIYDELGYQPLELTPTGQKKLNKDAYKYLIEEGCEAAELIQEYAQLNKLKGTYIEGILKRLDVNGVIHTTFNQHIADTARLTSSDPNLQNQLRKGVGNFNIKLAFIAGIGFVLIVGDYDQLEMYIAAHFSGDANLVRAIELGRDIHCANVEIVFDVPYDEIKNAKDLDDAKAQLDDRQTEILEYRYIVKSIGFGILYGKAAGSLSIQLGYPKLVAKKYPHWDDKKVNTFAREMAQDRIDLFFDKSPGLQKFIYQTIRDAYDIGYVETVLGRRRPLHGLIDWETAQEHKFAAQSRGLGLCWCRACERSRADERRAVNTRVQGSAADIAMLAMIKIQHDERLLEMGVKQTLQVHDEVAAKCPEPHKEEATEIIQWHMENPGVYLNVPLRASPHWAGNWAEAKG